MTTRRTGPRTGAIHVPKKLLDRIMAVLVSKGEKTDAGLVFDFSNPDLPLVLRQALAARGRKPQSIPIELGTYHLRSRETGRMFKVDVQATRGFHGNAAGATSISTLEQRRLSKPERRRLAQRALHTLGVTNVPPDSVIDQIVRFGGGLSVSIEIPDQPVKGRGLRLIRSVLAHELTHVVDESSRIFRELSEKAGNANDDVAAIAETLGLPPREGRLPDLGYEEGWENAKREVTAMIREIMEEIDYPDGFTKKIMHFRIVHPPRKTRDQSLIAFFRWASPTFAENSSHWTKKNLERVLRALWDRYHSQRGFPQAEGVLKNRRTSRRRTSRRPS